MVAVLDSPALKLDNVAVSYGAREIVSDIGLEVGAGTTFGLIGLNGAGKTTLIKAILGLRDNTRGNISIFGSSGGEPAARRNIAFLPERFDPPWFLCGMEFIRFSMSLYGRNADADEIAVAAARLALDPAVLKNRVQSYSKGMRQKLGLLATLFTGCPLLILDEPMSGLDPLARARVKDMLREARTAGRTIFLCSHILADMNEICDAVGVMDGGRLVFQGTPADLRATAGRDDLEQAFLSVLDARRAA